MKDGAIVANSGHFNVEINIPALAEMSKGKPNLVRPFVEQYTTKDGRKINILGEGRLINLAAAEGHPASVMDMSFANQALAAEFMVKNAKTLRSASTVCLRKSTKNRPHQLEAMGIKIDTLTDERQVLELWQKARSLETGMLQRAPGSSGLHDRNVPHGFGHFTGSTRGMAYSSRQSGTRCH
jgi:adenosylhomocysteinase